MIVYVKYFMTWLFFMALIAGITLLVPKISRKIDAWLAEKRRQKNADKEQEAVPELTEQAAGDNRDTPQE